MKSLAFESLIRQLRANPRLQWGAAIAVLLCAALALQAIDGWRSRMQQRSVDAEVEARKVIALRKQMVWVERSRALQVQADNMPSVTIGEGQDILLTADLVSPPPSNEASVTQPSTIETCWRLAPPARNSRATASSVAVSRASPSRRQRA